MKVLSLVHQAHAGPGVFADAVEAAGHEHAVWRVRHEPLPGRAEDYGAVLVFGGAMNVDETERHPWLAGEIELVRELHDRDVPLLGVCLGSQLIAHALGAPVGRAPRPERGWHDVDLTDAGAADPVLAGLPRRFCALQWHGDMFAVPDGGALLAESPVCAQAFRTARRAWGIQFHAEVTGESVERWAASRDGEVDAPAVLAETAERIEAWNELGRGLCARFLEQAAA